MRRKLLLAGAVLAMLLVVAGVYLRQEHVNAEVKLTGLAAWNLGPNTVVIRRVEVGDQTWSGGVESPPGFLWPLFMRFPALLEWWSSTHRAYTPGMADKEYVSIDAQVLGPKPELILTTLRMSVLAPDGLITAGTGQWTIVSGKPADLHATIEIPRGTQFHALELRMNNQRVSFPVRR